MTVHACTIIARNYLAAARVLASSFLEHHPDGVFTTLLIDDLYRAVDPVAEPFEILHLDEIGLSAAELAEMTAIYNVMELSTAVKPWLLRTLLDAGAPAVLYLDPDIKVYAPLDAISEAAREHGIVLTPHAVEPMPRDGKGTDESAILASGIYNLGFVAVGSEAGGLLDFWQERLRRECYVAPEKMRFVDQRWVDFVPGIFDVTILRDKTCNVAYWNLDHRDLRWSGERYEIDGEALGFFHFSGYSPDVPYLLSKHQGAKPRILLSERPAVARICAEYGADLLREGHREASAIEYAYHRTTNGMVLDAFMRRLYRDALVEAEKDGDPAPPSPFASGGAPFLEWVNAVPPRPGARQSRYLAAVYHARVDLQAVFPEPDGADAVRLADWARHEASVGRLDSRLAPASAVPGTRSDTPAPAGGPVAAGLRPGIRVAGYLRAETGVGEHGRLALEAVRRAGIEVAAHVDSHSLSRQRHPFFAPVRDDLDVNLVCVNADELANFASRVGEGFFAGRYNIGLWAWELEEFPARFAPSFKLLDEIWANSEFTREAIAKVAPPGKPVFAFPLPVAEQRVAVALDRSALGLPDGFLFLFCFDLMSVSARKNPLGLIEAFSRAFAPGEGPTLVVKAVGGSLKPVDLEELKWAAACRPDVVILDRYLDADQNVALVASCNSYVSLHRSEGFGLTLAEAMALGKPVIATGYSGNLDFMSPETSYLVPWTPGEVPLGSDPYPAGARWAEPDLDEAARLMRHVVAHPEEAAALGARARVEVLEHHGLEARSRFVAERFAHAQEVLAERRAGHLDEVVSDGASAAVAAEPPLIALARSRPSLEAPSSRARVARFFRRVVLRVLRHHDEHQRELDLALASGVEHVARLVTDLQGDWVRIHEHLANADGRLSLAESHARHSDADAVLAARSTLRHFEDHGERLAHVDHYLDEVRAALELLTKDVDEQGGELDHHRDLLRRVAGSEHQQLLETAAVLASELRSVPYMADPEAWLTVDDQGRQVIGYRGGGTGTHLASSGYAGFEDVFRGPEALVRDRQRVYLDLLVAEAPVLDVGCGRGELLELLTGAGIAASGVDADASMVARCREKGLEVVEGEGLAYLRALETSSLGALFCAQVVEHLHADELRALLGEAQRVLRPGGVFVAETVNPHALGAFKTFWTDPTHRLPLFPEVLVVLAAGAGFEAAEVIFPNGTGSLDVDRWQQGEYAVVARKAEA